MTETNRFRTVARALAAHMTDTYALLAAADSVIDADPYPRPADPVIPHDLIVLAALGSREVMDFMVEGKKINAIKAVRGLVRDPDGSFGIGLKAAKEAVEDKRVETEVMARQAPLIPEGNPWAIAPVYDETGTRGCSCGMADYGAPGHDGYVEPPVECSDGEVYADDDSDYESYAENNGVPPWAVGPYDGSSAPDEPPF